MVFRNLNFRMGCTGDIVYQELQKTTHWLNKWKSMLWTKICCPASLTLSTDIYVSIAPHIFISLRKTAHFPVIFTDSIFSSQHNNAYILSLRQALRNNLQTDTQRTRLFLCVYCFFRQRARVCVCVLVYKCVFAWKRNGDIALSAATYNW